MREYLFQLLETSSGELTAETIVLRMAVAAVIACFIFLSYRLSHSGSIYSMKFNVSLAVLTLPHRPFQAHCWRSACNSR